MYGFTKESIYRKQEIGLQILLHGEYKTKVVQVSSNCHTLEGGVASYFGYKADKMK